MARNLAKLNPFDELMGVGRSFFEDGIMGSVRALKLPTTDVYTEEDKRLVVEAHLGEFDEKDISVDLDKGVLVIQAERHEREEDKSKKYVVRESSTSFYRRVALPEQADESAIEARFENGILKVTVPFRELPSPKRIPIGGTSGAASAGAAGPADTTGSGESAGTANEAIG
jgi:HSP20 family protein